MSNLEFSIIIPTYKRNTLLNLCLRAIANLEFNLNVVEVIVVNDGCSTPPRDLITDFSDRLDISLLSQKHSGPAIARNTGAREAQGKYLAFIDDDCEPFPDWLSKLQARFNEKPDSCVGGQTINRQRSNICSTASNVLIHYLFSYYNREHEQARFLTSNNLAIPSECFHEIGGFNPGFSRAAAEDRELCDRCLHLGFPLTYAPEVKVYHNHDLRISSFIMQHFNYGRGAHRFHTIRARRSHTRVKLEPIDFYYRLLWYPFTIKTGRIAVLIALLIALTQVSNAIGFLSELFVREKTFDKPGRC